MKKQKLKLIYVIILTFLISISSFGTTRKVPQDHAKIQDAIDASVNGDTVLVAEGTYFENINYNGLNIVVTSLYAVDQNTDHILNTIIDGSNGVPGENGSCVALINYEDSTAVIQGFTIMNGSGTLIESWVEGGGIIMRGSSATVKNNIIKNNHVPAGGGGISAFRPAANPHIFNNIFTGNDAGGYAGGIVLNWTPGIVRNNIFYNNIAGAAFGGGGVLTWDFGAGNTAIIENNTIVGNHSRGNGGAIANYRTGNVIIRNNIIWGNTQQSGAQWLTSTGSVAEYNVIEDLVDPGTNITDNPKIFGTLFQLDGTSPCINAGDPDVEFNDTDDSRNDMGAYGGPNAMAFPSFSTDVLKINSNLVYTFNIGDTITKQIVISNKGTTTLEIDSLVFPEEINGIVNDVKMSGFELQVITKDSIPVKIIAQDAATINDSVLIYHNSLELENPLIAPIYFNSAGTSGSTDPDIRAYWKFDEGAGLIVVDEKGLSHGVINEQSIVRTDGIKDGAVGFSSDFAGTTITIDHNDSLDFKTDESFTLSLMIKCNPIEYTGELFYMYKGSSSGIGKWYAVSSKNGELRFTVDDNVTKTNLSYIIPEDFDSEAWHHVVCVRNRTTDYLYTYLDGNLVASTKDNTNQSIENGLPLLMSNFDPDTVSMLDDIIIYSKALSSEDVVSLYNSYGLPALSSDASVNNINVNNYTFEEGDFNPETKTYNVLVPEGTSSVNILVDANDAFAYIEGNGIFTTIPGTATITVKSPDLSSENTYNIIVDTYTSISEFENEKAFAIFPNPAEEVLNLTLKNHCIGNELIISDQVGKIVFSENVADINLVVNVSDYEPGVYFIKLKGTVKKVIIN